MLSRAVQGPGQGQLFCNLPTTTAVFFCYVNTPAVLRMGAIENPATPARADWAQASLGLPHVQHVHGCQHSPLPSNFATLVDITDR